MLLVVVYCLFRYNTLLLVSTHDGLAGSRGLRPLAVETEFSIVVAAVVMLSIRWVGVLMINAMLVIPAACARNISGSAQKYMISSVIIAAACGVFGLLLSFALGTSSGATIVLVMTACYAFTLTYVR